MNHALSELRTWIDKEGVASVLPKLATGVGKLDCNEIKPLIKQHLGDTDCTIYLYVDYHKGQKANEG